MRTKSVLGGADGAGCAVRGDGRAIARVNRTSMRGFAVMPARWDGWGAANLVHENRGVSRVLDGAQGCEIWYADGRRELDGIAGAGNAPLGHAHPQVSDAIIAHLARGLAYGGDAQAVQRAADELVDELAALTGLEDADTVMVNSGSEAIEAAMRIAMDYWGHRGQRQRDTVVAFDRGYHGCTALAQAISGLSVLNTGWAACVPRVRHVSVGLAHDRERAGGARALAAEFAAVINDAGPGRVAAVLVEPFLYAGGGIVLPEEFLAELRAVTRDADCLLIVDEVFTGFGRSGAAFACNEMPEPPDLLVMGSAMTNGVVPMGAVCVCAGIRESFGSAPLRYGHTTSGSGLACAAALATIDVLRTDGLFHAATTARWFSREFPRGVRWPGVVDLRTYGAVGIAQCDTVARAQAVAARARQGSAPSEGLIVGRHGTALMLTPALTATPTELGTMVAKLKLAIADVAIRGAAAPP